MARPTLSEQIDELRQQVTALKIVAAREEASNLLHQKELDRIRASIDKHSDKIAALENRATSLEERSKSLEKLNDRTWQIAPMVISVAGVLISLLVAYFKK